MQFVLFKVGDKLNIKTLLYEYGMYLRGSSGLSKNTYESYYRDTTQYVNYLSRIGIIEPESITLDNLRKYVAYLKQKKIAASSQSRKISAIKSFHKYLYIEHYTTKNISKFIANPKQIKKLPTILTVQEIDLILEACNEDDPLMIRNKAMIELAYASGLRVSELINLKLGDLHLGMGFINVLGKGSKERIVPVGEEAIDSLNLYLDKSRPILRKPKTKDAVFLTHYGKPLTRQGFYVILKDTALKAGIAKEVHPHMLRHSFATHMLAGGGDLRMIQELLGHEDISTTEIYTKIEDSRLREVINIHPMAKKEKK